MMFFINYFVYDVNYLVCLLITTRTNQIGKYNTYCMLVWDLWFTIISCSQAPPFESGGKQPKIPGYRLCTRNSSYTESSSVSSYKLLCFYTLHALHLLISTTHKSSSHLFCWFTITSCPQALPLELVIDHKSQTTMLYVLHVLLHVSQTNFYLSAQLSPHRKTMMRTAYKEYVYTKVIVATQQI